MSDNLDPAFAAMLAALLEATEGNEGLRVAELRRRLGLPFSLFMRTLSSLIDAKLVVLRRLRDQNIVAGLSDRGLALARRQQEPPGEALREAVS